MFDYDVIARCEYEVLDNYNNSFACGKPALYRVWWDTFGKHMKVCKEHLEYIKKCEAESDMSYEEGNIC